MCFQLQEVPWGTNGGFITPSVLCRKHFNSVMWVRISQASLDIFPGERFQVVQAGDGRGLWHWVVGDSSKLHNEKNVTTSSPWGRQHDYFRKIRRPSSKTEKVGQASPAWEELELADSPPGTRPQQGQVSNEEETRRSFWVVGDGYKRKHMLFLQSFMFIVFYQYVGVWQTGDIKNWFIVPEVLRSTSFSFTAQERAVLAPKSDFSFF